MKPLSTDEIRQSYLAFFQGKGHAVIPGASLIPENDPTVLFTTAGMHPLVPYLLGEPHPAGRRLTDVQRCVRTQDIDEVGDTSHLTFFEMLGNWSLGDYFKEGAIAMSFEFLTHELGIPADMLAVTCFEGDNDAPRDEESAAAWEKMGIPRERIGFLPKAKNWWGPAGQTGPCGPDTEMFFWVGKGKPQGNPATHEAQWLEIWNDVFMQYNKTAAGVFEPLKQKNVDTGMGLERAAAVLQGKASVYETDRLKPIYEKVLCSVKNPELHDYEPLQHGKDAARIITDHLRASTFIIADGVQPSNVDRGYVLRRLIRKAIRAARSMSVLRQGEFCAEIAESIIQQYGHVYTELQSHRDIILETLRQEERKFSDALEDGFRRFDFAFFVPEGAPIPKREISAYQAFDLYTTYGFPLEIIKEEAEHRRIPLEPDFDHKFNELFEAFKAKSRAGAEQRFKGGLQDHSSETTKLHTATHLLNAALRKVLGEHVYQKGSNITAERLRFDFSHGDKMSPEQIRTVEELVNDAIRRDLPVSYHVTTVEKAKAEGAIGVFDAKYGAEVKVYVMGNFSREICGGPHAARTGFLGSFKILKEESSSAGVRRIKAVVEGGPKDIEVAKEEAP